MSPCVVIDASRGLLTVGGQTLLCAEADDSGRRRVGGDNGPLVRPLSFGVRSALVARASADPAPDAALRALVVTASMLDAGEAPAAEAFLAAAVAALALSGAGEVDLPFALCRRLLSERGGLDDAVIARMAAADADRLALALSSGIGPAASRDGGWRQFVLTDPPEAGVPQQMLDEISLELARTLLERGRGDAGTDEPGASNHHPMARPAVNQRLSAAPPTAPSPVPGERRQEDRAAASAEAGSSAIRSVAGATAGFPPAEPQGAGKDAETAAAPSPRRVEGKPARPSTLAEFEADEPPLGRSPTARPISPRPRARFTIVPSATPAGLAETLSAGSERPQAALAQASLGAPQGDASAESIESRPAALDPVMNSATPAQAAGQAALRVRLPATKTFAGAEPVQPGGWRANSAAVAVQRQTADRASSPPLPAAAFAAASLALTDDLADALAALLNDEANLRGID